MKAPIGFIGLCEAVDAVGRAVLGTSWQYAISFNFDADQAGVDHERVITMIAEGCEVGTIEAAYQSLTGAEKLDRRVWQMPQWRNYFTTGRIDLVLPLRDENWRPVQDGRTSRCTFEVFVRRDSLDRFIKNRTTPPSFEDEEPLKNASEQAIRAEMSIVASDPANDRPNVRELARLVKTRLHERGLHVAENRIIEIGGEPEFQALRRPTGKTKASEQRR
jgi:hypothetical protein